MHNADKSSSAGYIFLSLFDFDFRRLCSIGLSCSLCSFFCSCFNFFYGIISLQNGEPLSDVFAFILGIILPF